MRVKVSKKFVEKEGEDPDSRRGIQRDIEGLGMNPHRIEMMTILNNSCHFLVDANLTEMPDLPVE